MATKCPKCQSDNPDTQQFCGDCGTRIRGHVPDSPESGTCPQNSVEEGSPSITKTLETPVCRLAIGSLFAGRYEILEELGKGGMGEVYRARDKKLGEEIAIKVLKPEIAADKETIERFKNELKFSRKIAHRRVCKMYDLSEEGETPFITMEHVRGKTLKNLIREKGEFEEKKAIEIAKQVCEGLAEAHELGVVHRDLKPQNIMIDEKGSAKIMDFGIARSLEAPGVTKAGVMIGTPDYISPEQAEGLPADRRSDIYSLGIILYEMATGALPFKGDTAFSLALKHKTQLPKDPGKVNPGISEKLSRLILVCMEKDKERRYQSAKELLADLQNIEDGLPLGTKIRPRRESLISSLIRKKLFVPAAILALAIVVVASWLTLFRKGVPTTSQVSVAVLPFADLSPQKDHEWLSDGISEAMINALSSLRNLRVPARTSSFFFKEKEVHIREIGEKLNVKNVLEGSVQVAGDTLRITAQLISVQDGYHLWSEKFDRKLDDVFSIQDEIAQEVVKALKVRLLGEEESRLTTRHTKNLEAYNLYLQGRYFWDKRGRESLNKSIEYFEKALEKDPNYALAYAGLADSYLVLGNNGIIPPGEAYTKAKEYVLKALEKDNGIAEAHATMASIMRDYDWDWTHSEKECRLAVQLNPGYGYAHQAYAFLLSMLARHEEAIKEIKIARDIDPLAPRITANVGNLLYKARKYDQALEELRKAIELYPEHAFSHALIARVYIALSRYEAAFTSLQTYEKAAGEEPILDWAYLFAKWGKRIEAENMLTKAVEKSSQTYVPPSSMAFIYGVLGDSDRAFSLLDRAFSERDVGLTFLKVEPWYDPLRSDPRFKALLKKMNLD